MDEFALIEKYFAPLSAKEKGAFGLKDDAAVLSPPPGRQLVVTTDTIIESVHFIGDETGAQVAKKLLRVNLSDLAAMGAKPYACLLNLSLPKHTDEAWLASFAEGLREDLETFDLVLAGGDTTATPGPLTLSLTALGWVEYGKSLTRSGARPGDLIFVSGTLGDATLGLQVLKGALIGAAELTSRYLLPEPRVALGQALPDVANAAIDVSDGLLQDLGHICAASHVGAEIYADAVPRSDAAASAEVKTILTGGDDYELLFTAPSSRQDQLQSLAHQKNVRISVIGKVTQHQDIVVLEQKNGLRMDIPVTGYRHFS